MRLLANDVSNHVARSRSPKIPARLRVSQPSDPDEQEADRWADRVMRVPDALQRACACGGGCPRCRAQSARPEQTHLVQQDSGAVHARIQRQTGLGSAPARRTTTYSFPGCTDTQIEILSRNIRQSYLMVINARDQMTNLILSIIQAESSREYEASTDAIVVRRIVGRLYGADTLEVLRAVRNNYTRIANRYLADREVECHDGSERNAVASAEIGGTHIWIGPRFFSKYSDNLDARPRIFIHEMAHNAGIEHDMTGIAITAGSTETRPAQVAHHADSYAELAYRLYTRDFFGRMNRELEI